MDQENLRENTVSTHTLRTYAWKYFQKYLLLLPRVHKEEGEILERELKNKTKKKNPETIESCLEKSVNGMSFEKKQMEKMCIFRIFRYKCFFIILFYQNKIIPWFSCLEYIADGFCFIPWFLVGRVLIGMGHGELKLSKNMFDLNAHMSSSFFFFFNYFSFLYNL